MVMSDATGFIALRTPGSAQYFAPFIRSGILAAVDVHVVDALHQLTSGTKPEALLALALAVRAPRHGHICIDLGSIADTAYSEATALDSPEEGLQLPWPNEGWRDTVAQSPLVHQYEECTGIPILAPFVLHGTQLYMNRYWQYQERLAANIAGRVTAPRLALDAPLLAASLRHLFGSGPTVDRQQLGVAMAALRPFAVISGGPGMGKTHTVRNLLTVAYLQHESLRNGDDGASSTLRVALAAPTGKAAARLRSSISDGIKEHMSVCSGLCPDVQSLERMHTFLTTIESFTVHRLLGFNPKNRSRFRFNAEKTLPYDVVIVDEASMVDFAMMTKLVDAIPPESRLILLGDKHQLASVDAGSVLRDLCGPVNSEELFISETFRTELMNLTGLSMDAVVSHSKEQGLGDSIIQLNRNYRFSDDSGIGAFAASCLRNDVQSAIAVFDDDSCFGDVQRIEHVAHGLLSETLNTLIVDELSPFVHRLLRGPQAGETDEDIHRHVLELFDQARLLCTHRSGALGVDGINSKVEDLLRQNGRSIGFSAQGRTYLGRPIMVTQNDYTTGLFNGDIGLFVDCRVGDQVIRRVVFPSDEGVRYVAPARLPAHDTAYAMTIHKSQGSQFQHAIVILPQVPSRLVTRELIYTGVTRAGQKVTLVGSREVLKKGLQQEVQRASGLRSLLWSGSLARADAND